MIVRRATVADFPALIDMGKAMHEESAFNWLPFSSDKLAALGEAYLRDPSRVLFVCEDSVGGVVGMFAGYVTPYYFCDATIATELFWYVLPAVRGTSAAIRLLREFERWAAAQGAAEIAIASWTGVAPTQFNNMLERAGFTHRGANFSRRIV